MTTALIDADILIYKAACGAEQEIRWPDGVWTYSAKEEDGIELVEGMIKEILEDLNTDKYILCFSDVLNFRKEVYPSYKSNRKDSRVPLIRQFLHNHFLVMHPSASYVRVEADDVMGILATAGGIEDPVIVTIDKDLLQIPVPVWNFDNKEMHKPEHRDTEKLFLKQVLTGDAVDGYPGCPGVGESTAEVILDTPFLWEEYEHEFKSGVRKGLTELRFRKAGECSIWESIVSHYEKAGLTEEDAIVQSRCAKILQAENYNEDGSLNLWEPNDE